MLVSHADKEKFLTIQSHKGQNFVSFKIINSETQNWENVNVPIESDFLRDLVEKLQKIEIDLP